MSKIIQSLGAAVVLASASVGAVSAQTFTLTSPEIAEGKALSAAQVANVFGCKGGNSSPELSWSGAPADTKSFVVTVYDPDAPTGSGFWHWSIFNIPASVTKLAAGLKADKGPAGSVQIRNDYGFRGFGGACPPPGAPHRYVFTVHAMKVEKFDLNADATPAVVGFYTLANSIGKASITAIYAQ